MATPEALSNQPADTAISVESVRYMPINTDFKTPQDSVPGPGTLEIEAGHDGSACAADYPDQQREPEGNTGGNNNTGESPAGPVTYRDIFLRFLWLGWIAFGGPAAHLALFQKIFVEKLRWISPVVFLELLGLSQCLPGPTSTQVSFALGVVQKGVSGGLLSGFLFQYPGFLIAALAGAGAANFLKNPRPWLKGLLAGLGAVGVALFASAAKSLTYSTCHDKVTMIVNASAAVISFYLYNYTWIYPTLILAGGLTTLVFRWKVVSTTAEADRVERLGFNKVIGSILVVAWAATLAIVMTLRRQKAYEDWKQLYWFEAFYRVGSIIFGGGQVVLPLLQIEVVETGWVSLQDYLTGFALVQAMPGPVFNISAYLGAIIAFNAHTSVVGGIFNCWVALSAPGTLLIYGVMPWWGVFRNFQIYRRLLPGANAAAVGLIVSAVFLLAFKIYDTSPFPNTSICIGIIGFSLVDFVGCPAPLAVAVGAVCGVIGWAGDLH